MARPTQSPRRTEASGGTGGTGARARALALAAGAAIALATPALAEGTKPRAALRAAVVSCMPAAMTHCSTVEPGEGRILACLAERRASLSEPCRVGLDRVSAMRDAVRACWPDAARLCAAVEPGAGRIAACLRENRPALGEGCQGALAAAEQALEP